MELGDSVVAGSPFMTSRKMTVAVDLCHLHQCWPDRYPCLLSSASGAVNGHRYDILFAGLQSVDLKVLDQVDVTQQRQSQLPFIGGYVFLLPYEYAQQVEPHLHLQQHASVQPLVWRVSAAFIWDKERLQLTVVASDRQWFDDLWEDWAKVAEQPPLQPMSAIEAMVTEEPEAKFLSGVERCRDYILAGDVFQVNLSRQWQACIDPGITAGDIFLRLRSTNPAPFSALLTWQQQAVVSSSPERLISVRDGVIETRPIAGTRRRGECADSDRALIDELRVHPKENAEHIMLLDLERNDLGRVCQPGSVRVNELMSVESYQHVHHIVSNVVGQLRQGTTAQQAIDAVFPGGTITGCPKVRCMEIIAELEQMPRGIYTGSIGYVSLDGQMDVNILIRSFHWQPGLLTFRAGAGIVYDSLPELELEETRHKARGLLRVLQGPH